MAHAGPVGVEVREAAPEDGPALVAAIAAINRETPFLAAEEERPVWADAPATMLKALRARDDGVYVIALRDGGIVGYLSGFRGPYRSTRGVLTATQMGVRQAARRQGIGARLFAVLETWGRARGVHRLDLTVDETNAGARALNRATGWVEEGIVRDGAREADGWRSFVSMARLLDEAPLPLPSDPAPRTPRTDSLTVAFRTLDTSDAAVLRAWEIALLSAPPVLLKAADEVAAPAAFEAELASLLASPLHYPVAALVDEAIVGLVVVSAKPQARVRHDLGIVVNVLGPCRGLGIGQRLLAIGEDWARAQGAHRLSTAVHAANAPGLRFATAAGFTREVTMRRYACIGDRHVDLLIFGKILDG